jgi:cyclophilin family peptidyl-prolyl cis-trans isomerase
MKNNRLLLSLLALLFSIVASAAGPERVRVTTSLGSFVIELQRDRAPLTVENFVTYVRAGQYTNTLFHRTIANFVIQGGGVGPDYKAKPNRAPIPNESGNGLKNVRGTVGLARSGLPHSGDCQIYVNVADNGDLDPLPTRWGYAVFGRVIDGMEVVDRISVSATGSMGPFKQDAPLQAVIIQKIEMLADSSSPAPVPAEAPLVPSAVAPEPSTASPTSDPAAPVPPPK